MANLSFFDYNNGIYAETMLSYYLWGQPTPPTPNEIADDKFIRPLLETDSKNNTVAAVTIEVDATEYMQKVGNNLPLAQQKIFQDFFNNTNRYVALDKKFGLNDEITISDLNQKITKLKLNNTLDIRSSNTEIYLTHTQFIDLFYRNKLEEINKIDTSKLDSIQNLTDSQTFSASQYSIDPSSEDYWQRALVFGSTSLKLDVDKIRYVFDAKTGKALRLEDVYVTPNHDNYDLESSNGLAALVNPILARMTDLSGIGRKVDIQYTQKFENEKWENNGKSFLDSIQLNNGIFTQEQYRSYVASNPFQTPLANPVFGIPSTIIDSNIPKPLTTLSSVVIGNLLHGLFKLNELHSHDFEDETGRIVFFGSQINDTFDGYKNNEIDLNNFVNKQLLSEMLASQFAEDNRLVKLIEEYSDVIGDALVTWGFLNFTNIVGKAVILAKLAELTAESLINKYEDALNKGVVYVAGDGNDTITGTDKADKFIGGQGFDTYHIQGADVIIDSDMSGKIIFNQDENTQFQFKRNPSDENHWYSVNESNEKDGLFTAIRQSSDLLITQNNTQNYVVIRDFFNSTQASQGEYTGLNISLEGVETQTGKLFVGDSRPKIDFVGRYYHEWDNRDEKTGKIIDGIDEENFNDMIHGSIENDIMKGLGGHDALDGKAGHDVLEGGDGSDLLIGGGGADTMYGGDGNDFILSEGELQNYRKRPDDNIGVESN